jgi:hypothetical protein
VCVEQADVDMVLLVPSPTLVLDNPIKSSACRITLAASIQHSVDMTAHTHDVGFMQEESCHCWEHVCSTVGHTTHTSKHSKG